MTVNEKLGYENEDLGAITQYLVTVTRDVDYKNEDLGVARQKLVYKNRDLVTKNEDLGTKTYLLATASVKIVKFLKIFNK